MRTFDAFCLFEEGIDPSDNDGQVMTVIIGLASLMQKPKTLPTRDRGLLYDRVRLH